jgi:hypothetical protein
MRKSDLTTSPMPSARTARGDATMPLRASPVRLRRHARPDPYSYGSPGSEALKSWTIKVAGIPESAELASVIASAGAAIVSARN